MARLPSLLIVAILAFGTLAGCLEASTTKETDAEKAKRLGAAGIAHAVFPGDYRFDARYSQVLVEGLLEKVPPVRTFIKSPIDQADIEIGYWLPKVPEGTTVPVLVHASPYHRPAGSVVRENGMKQFLVDNFLPHGYAVAAVAVRGTADSGGCMDLMGNKENRDLDAAITWLGTQPWSNGNTAMIGVSYDGSTPWSVAGFGNKHLKTIVPISGVPDVYGLMYKNGSSESRGPIRLNQLYYEYGWSPSDPNRSADKRVSGLLCPESLAGIAWSGYSGYYGERDPAGWWAERNRKPLVEKNYKASILSVQGLQDWNVDPHMVIPWGDQLAQRGLYVKQMLGQWAHASPDSTQNSQSRPTTRWDWAEILLHWFDYWLKDQTTIDLGPRVQVQDHLMRWRNEERFPPVDADWLPYHLAAGNQLLKQPAAAGSMLLLPTPQAGNPGLRAAPGYQSDFYTPPVQNETLLSGLPRLHITVEPQGPHGFIAAWLYDVDENGTETRIGWTMMNLLFADGTEKARPITPGQPIVAKMEFQPLDAAIKPGHKLLLRVWQFREADRQPGVAMMPVELHWGGNTKSVLELPIVERDPSLYFNPPFPAGFDFPGKV